jgi:6,7-dimethyl-8-ribityllumazine synthase
VIDGHSDPHGIYRVCPEKIAILRETFGHVVMDATEGLLVLDAGSDAPITFGLFNALMQRTLAACIAADAAITGANAAVNTGAKKRMEGAGRPIPLFGAKRLDAKREVTTIFRDFVIASGGMVTGSYGHRNLVATRMRWMGPGTLLGNDKGAMNIAQKIKAIAEEIQAKVDKGLLTRGHRAAKWAQGVVQRSQAPLDA